MASVVQSPEGGSYIPASQRPDGTWRKARRVKEGYVPQEEVPLYESKGKQWANRKPIYPVGLPQQLIDKREAALAVANEEEEKKKKPGETPGVEATSSSTLSGSEKHQKPTEVQKTPVKTEQPVVAVEPAKRLKNLRKKLREIEIIEQKIKSKELKNPEKDQLEKISRKTDILSEILALELSLN